jgi:uncharacterized protein YukE
MSGLTDSYDRLRGEWSALSRQWEGTRAEWCDSIGDRFEREFWPEWEDEVPKLLRAMSELDEALDAALRHTAG